MADVVAVSDPRPVYRDGLSAALGRCGFVVQTDDDTLQLRNGSPRVLLMTVQSEADLRRLRERASAIPDLVAIALLTDALPEAYVAALQAGAAAVVADTASAERIVATVTAAIDGDVVLPAAVARMLARRCPDDTGLAQLTAEEGQWLIQLARGVSVAALAGKAGYSERTMHRLLHALYGRLGVSNRDQAVALAASRGLHG